MSVNFEDSLSSSKSDIQVYDYSQVETYLTKRPAANTFRMQLSMMYVAFDPVNHHRNPA